MALWQEGREVYADQWQGYGVDDCVHVMSVTKSVVSLLVGIGLDLGLIDSVEQPVLDFFPAYQPKRGEKTIQQVRLRHLLTMTAPYKYRHEPWSKVCSSDDWTLAALDLLGGRSGLDGTSKYSTLGIHILSGILAGASGLNTVDFANKYLFGPLGIAPRVNYLAETAQEHKQLIIAKQPRGPMWICDPQGVGAAGFGLCLSAGEMAKLGQLCLDGGCWQGKRLVSAQWIAESTRPRSQWDESFAHMGYGYLWWTPDMHDPAYAALGNSGNVIYIDPPRRAVAAVAANFKPTVLDRVDFIKQHLLPLLD